MDKRRFTDDAQITSGGQLTIPKDVCEVLGVADGNSVTFVVNGDEVRLENSFIHALHELQEAMKGEAERLGIKSEDDVVALVKEIRAEL